MGARTIAGAALALSLMTLPTTASARFDGGGKGGSGSDGDWAVNDELKNPRLIEPGSPYGYDRSYSRRPNWIYPPAYQAIPKRPQPRRDRR